MAALTTAALLGSTAISAAGSAVAANQQRQAAKGAVATTARAAERLAPYQQAGQRGLDAYTEQVMVGPGEFQESEGYRFTLGQGMEAIDRSSAAGGNVGTGAARKGLINYAQGLASTEYDRFLDRYNKRLAPYAQLANVGFNATTAGLGAAGQQAGYQLDSGIASGNIYSGIANSVRSGLSDAVTLSQLSGQRTPMNTGSSIPTVNPNMQTLGTGDTSLLSIGAQNRKPMYPYGGFGGGNY